MERIRMMEPLKVVIIGAAGRDFHDYNVFFKPRWRKFRVMAFTQAAGQNMSWKPEDIGEDGFKDRRYPPSLAGKRHPDGIPIWPENMLEQCIKRYDADVCVMSYSDIAFVDLNELMLRSNAAGAAFTVLAPRQTMIRSKLPTIAIVASRTGAGKSTLSRYVCKALEEVGVRVVPVRHPMPYGDLEKQKVQRFKTYKDLDRHECTLEEREEYEPHIDNGRVVFAGVDYEAILKRAEKEADIILWDGGNNDCPFYAPDLYITIVDPFRAGDELDYHPGATNVRLADIVVVNKVDTAPKENVERMIKDIRRVNPRARIVKCASPLVIDRPELVKGKSILVLEDGPTVTHGDQPGAAGYQAAKKYKAKRMVDPRPYAASRVQKRMFEKFTHIGNVLPTMGYGAGQIKDLERTIAKVKCDSVLFGTPIDLRRVMKIEQPVARVSYDIVEKGGAQLKNALTQFVKDHCK